MRCPNLVATLLGLAGLAACNPTFNWREVRADSSALVALLPCKPDRGTRTVPLAGRPTELQMVGCESGGATFALAKADVADAAQAGSTLAQWRVITLANARAGVTGKALLESAPNLAEPAPAAGKSGVAGKRGKAGTAGKGGKLH